MLAVVISDVANNPEPISFLGSSAQVPSPADLGEDVQQAARLGQIEQVTP